jgi:hypothetical protein
MDCPASHFQRDVGCTLNTNDPSRYYIINDILHGIDHQDAHPPVPPLATCERRTPQNRAWKDASREGLIRTQNLTTRKRLHP